MRTDNVTTYILPTLEACQDFLEKEAQDEKKLDEIVVVGDALPPSPFLNNTARDFLTLELHPLPLLTAEGDQTPIGARGWYSSAVLSSMLLSGHPILTKDVMSTSSSNNKSNRMMLELGSGTLGLAGMTLAWVVAQQQQQQQHSSTTTKTKIVLTDYDDDVLGQLEKNCADANQRLQRYFGGDDKSNSKNNNMNVPTIEAAHLDWNEYDQDQALLQDTVDVESTDNGKDNSSYAVTFVCGAALVYCEETAACADQIAKILQQHAQAAVWVVQWPRKGWFSVLQQQLQHKFGLRVEKFAPTNIHPRIHELAQHFMPPQLELDTAHIKAVRITSPSKVE